MKYGPHYPSRPKHRWRGRPVVALLAGLLPLLLAGCETLPPPAGPSEVEATPVALADLPEGARVESLGNVGTAYRLSGDAPIAGTFPVAAVRVEGLLPDTLRLFRFDTQTGAWAEIGDSSYDKKNGRLTGANLTPGLYTAFGWSANPVANALQRMIFDSQLGYRSAGDQIPTLAELREQVAVADFDAQTQLLQGWLDLSVSLERTNCETLRGEDDSCPLVCRRLAGRRKLSSCPEECPEPECCFCQTFSWPERVRVPGSFLPRLPEPCSGGLFCPPCPLGLSCPTGPGPRLQVIGPTLSTPDYAVMNQLGLGEVVEDVALRDILHRAIEGSLGREYPVPPPWP